jgi:hypothetical protein
MGRVRSTNKGEEKIIQDFGGTARRKETIGRPRRKWENSIKMGISVIACADSN